MADRKPNAPADWPERFLAAYRKSGNISKAAKAARVTRPTVYDHKKADPAFESAMADALEDAVELLEEEARRRAVDGTLRPVFYQGAEVGQVREYSDTLLIVLLKANKPQKYKERADITSGEEPIKGYIGFNTDGV